RAPEMASAGGCKRSQNREGSCQRATETRGTATETLLHAETCSHGPVSRPIITSHSSRSSNGAQRRGYSTPVLPLSAVCPDSVFGCPERWECLLVEKGQIGLLHSVESAYGKERLTWPPSYRSIIRHDPK